MADNNTTQDNLQSITLGFDGVMAMIGTTAGLIPGKQAEVFAASFGVMNGTITGVIGFEGSSQAQTDLEKALLGTLVGTVSGILIAAALTAVGAATPIIILGAGATALATGLTGDWQYDKYTAAQKTFFDWVVKNNYDLEIKDLVNDFFNFARNWIARYDPLVLDLDGDGIETVGVNATTHILFDHNNDGIKTGTGWVNGDDGLLVLDRNGNGVIDNGSELFGDGTMVNGVKATDGFSALNFRHPERVSGSKKSAMNNLDFNKVRGVG
jgi:hypothetical protein